MDKKITFTITEEEIREVAEKINYKIISKKHIKTVLGLVECDEILWKKIEESIIYSLYDSKDYLL